MKLRKALSHIFLIFISIISIGPFIWLLSTAIKSPDENIFQYPPNFIPESPTLINFIDVWNKVPFDAYIINSFIVAIFTIILNLVLSALAAYPLARMNFKGKNFIFYAILATIMIPFQVIMIPVYLMVLRLGMVDSVSNIAGFAGLILPFAVNAFGIFLMRQAFLGIPKELEEAAVIDGCNTFDIWWRIFIPLTKPALATLAIFTFVGAWSEFLWPSIVLTKQEMYTLPVGLTHLQGVFSANWRYIAAGAIMSIIPILALFLALQRYFISGTTQGAVKG
ncbi:MAG: sugar ABC transporter permease [Candidatus Melainabacteria bacterium RIFOXYA12_FULL_32_12]|nr:MAG: sugar ABC transporter permease [Candidatus Melainabacteria bacterium RIFOXYA12_FULL_32_12]